MGVAVPMVVISVIMRMPVPMVCVAKGGKTYDIDEEAQNTDNQKFI